jgi:hypothetical protein
MATNNAVNNSLTGQTGTGNFVGSTSPTLTTPIINSINDTNGNTILSTIPIAASVNYVSVSNASAGGQCGIYTQGTDTNINVAIIPKGVGILRYYTEATVNQITVNTGASYAHETIFQFSTTSASRTATFPDLTGTVQLASNTGTTGQVLTSNGAGVAPSYQNAAGGTDAAFGFLLMGG